MKRTSSYLVAARVLTGLGVVATYFVSDVVSRDIRLLLTFILVISILALTIEALVAFLSPTAGHKPGD